MLSISVFLILPYLSYCFLSNVKDAIEKKNCLCNNPLRKKCPYLQFSGPHFASFELNAKIYRVNLHIQSECSGIL